MKAKYTLGDDPDKNRAILKRFIRNHAEKFNMSEWIELNGRDAEFDEAKDPQTTLEIFEECGTACCIAGAISVLTASEATSTFTLPVEKFGLPRLDIDDLFYASRWPGDLGNKYYEARNTRDFKRMAKLGCRAIDKIASRAK